MECFNTFSSTQSVQASVVQCTLSDAAGRVRRVCRAPRAVTARRNARVGRMRGTVVLLRKEGKKHSCQDMLLNLEDYANYTHDKIK